MPAKKASSSKRLSKPAGEHTPVSNLAIEGAAAKGAAPVAAMPPSEGAVKAPIKAPKGMIEDVKGFKLREATEEELASLYSVPDMSGLRDIGEASFGPPALIAETVHGPDDRVRINNTADYPWRVHASLLITAADDSRWLGTGWFIGPHTVMTAGHVVYIRNGPAAGWVKSIDVMPGRNGTSLPYGKITSRSFCSVIGWTQSGNENYDYGAIILPNNLGATIGWLGFGVYSDADLLQCVGNISGYPADKPSGTQWYDAHKIASVNANKVYYDIDTYGGQSGSAVYRIKNGGRYGIAVHAYGGAVTNSGTRITKPVFDNMAAWKA